MSKSSTINLPRRAGVCVSAVVSVLGLLVSCSGLHNMAAPNTTAAATVDTRAAGLWAQRPQVSLSFTVAPDLHTVNGRESLVFTPDMRTCDLVFRAWPNDPSEAASGASLVVSDAAVQGHPVAPRVSSGGAAPSAPGTVIDLPMPACLNPGQSIHADLGFTLTLGADSQEVLGYSPSTQTAWFGQGYPLLAWVRGKGWVTDPAVKVDGDGDFPVSEDYQLALSVTAPTAYQVMGTGVSTGDGPGPTPDTTVHRFTAPAVRDVSIGVGRYTVLNRTIGGVTLHLATPTIAASGSGSGSGSGSESGRRKHRHSDSDRHPSTTPDAWAEQIADSVTSLSAIFGPFPYPDLWATVIPTGNDGQEYPTALQLGAKVKQKRLKSLVAHEVSHQWFYSLVGNNQAEDPWLDEALATFGEGLVGGDASQYQYSDTSKKVVGLMGKPVSYFVDHGGSDRYDDAVYNQGAAVLLEARKQVGADAFDAAMRTYIQRNAHRVATPADFASAFAGLPVVLNLLREAGALPGGPPPETGKHSGN